ncbi:GntR family transcriptional regulator [Vibrio gazogenes]|uniref:GntR family transcriptional regulator n=1 Tax=Vibrio gazogenes DSM 21264 = NBRC 103151 TaxID=1123492 RepID=A0A1M5BP37_VIBGA|nr:GntR family transcriptional regulator [Vibrio gazogenes]USP13715.1 GntR family transcriptional regulator [Vibrio gazogenes]SHF44298.1 GntR family transcriptional regulator [Vibrio gazogenes DSM 21264] [Vibrio gazogenes DSM 21264 = NBRC 103151]SJN57189.1 HTH-type transcriptional repressor YvoA [Vibrio gazogenes]
MDKSHKNKDFVKDAILKMGELSESCGDMKLPSELSLCSMLEVSRSTIREVLAQLIQEGVVYRVRGKGAYLRRGLTSLNLDLTKLFSVSDAIKSCGLSPKTILKYKHVKTASQLVASKLNIDEGDKYVEIKRLRYANDKIAVFNIHHFRLHAIEHASDDALCGSLFDYLEETGKSISYAKTKIKSVVLTQRDIPEMDVALEPFILLEETYYSDSGEVFCYTEDYYSDEIFSFDIIRRRS